jgi:hypothetical protein
MKEVSVNQPMNRRVEFFELDGVQRENLAICNFGEHGSGKTRLIATAPGPVGVVPLDIKTRGTIERVRHELCPDKKILFPKQDYIRHADPMKLAMMDHESSMKYYRQHVNSIKDAAFSLAERKDVKTIAIDNGTQLFEDMMYACYGRTLKIMPRDRGEVNQEIKNFLNSLQHKHLIITHRAAEIWRGPEGKEKPTGEYRLKGFSDMGYYVNLLLEHRCNEEKWKEGEPRFSIHVHMCQARASLMFDDREEIESLTDELITFQNIAVAVYPDSDYGDWE